MHKAPHRHTPSASGRVPGAHSTVICVSVRGGREEEKKKQPDRKEDKSITTRACYSIVESTPSGELAMLERAREVIFSYSLPQSSMNNKIGFMRE
jgi:hypothetical protein